MLHLSICEVGRIQFLNQQCCFTRNCDLSLRSLFLLTSFYFIFTISIFFFFFCVTVLNWWTILRWVSVWQWNKCDCYSILSIRLLSTSFQAKLKIPRWTFWWIWAINVEGVLMKWTHHIGLMNNNEAQFWSNSHAWKCLCHRFLFFILLTPLIRSINSTWKIEKKILLTFEVKRRTEVPF